MSERFQEVKGTKSFLYWSIGLACLSIWAIRDGWYPTTNKVTEKVGKALISETYNNEDPVLKEIKNRVKKEIKILQDKPFFIPEGRNTEFAVKIVKKGVKEGWMKGSDMTHKLAYKEIVHFTNFNKSLTLISVIGTLICGFFHIKVR